MEICVTISKHLRDLIRYVGMSKSFGNITGAYAIILAGLVALGYSPGQKHRQVILQARAQVARKGALSTVFNYDAKVLVVKLKLLYRINYS